MLVRTTSVQFGIKQPFNVEYLFGLVELNYEQQHLIQVHSALFKKHLLP